MSSSRVVLPLLWLAACGGGDKSDPTTGTPTGAPVTGNTGAPAGSPTDPCPLDDPDDSDGDGVCDSDDLCPGTDDQLCDADGDGFTPTDGDCDDATPEVGPGAFEWLGDASDPLYVPVDEDCDGTADNPWVACDSGLAVSTDVALDAARALGLCKVSTGPGDWGVVTAAWSDTQGPPAPAAPDFPIGHGVVEGFGNAILPEEGQAALLLSTGTARNPGQPGFADLGGFDKGFTSPQPFGFPKEPPFCVGALPGAPHDTAAIELVLRAPTNAHGVQFDFRYFTYDWPGFVCSTYNDVFVAELTPYPAGLTDGNIAFDASLNPISVNSTFLDVCSCPGGPPCYAGGVAFACPAGSADLFGTGFGAEFGGTDHGGTTWLSTQAPVTPGSEITLRFMIFDSGDGVLDSTVLLDNVRWLPTAPAVNTQRK